MRRTRSTGRAAGVASAGGSRSSTSRAATTCVTPSSAVTSGDRRAATIATARGTSSRCRTARRCGSAPELNPIELFRAVSGAGDDRVRDLAYGLDDKLMATRIDADCWRDVLSVRTMGALLNYFDRGGSRPTAAVFFTSDRELLMVKNLGTVGLHQIRQARARLLRIVDGGAADADHGDYADVARQLQERSTRLRDTRWQLGQQMRDVRGGSAGGNQTRWSVGDLCRRTRRRIRSTSGSRHGWRIRSGAGGSEMSGIRESAKPRVNPPIVRARMPHDRRTAPKQAGLEYDEDAAVCDCGHSFRQHCGRAFNYACALDGCACRSFRAGAKP